MQEQNNNKETEPISISVEIPYLAMYDKILSESSSTEDAAGKIAAIMNGRIGWDDLISSYSDNERMRELTVISFPKSQESEGLAFGLMTVSASNTFFNTRREVLFTGSTVYTNLSLIRSVWEFGENEEMLREFNPVKLLKQDDFIETVNALTSENSVIPVSKEISYLHGSFSRDTWHLLGSIITRPVTVKPFGAGITGETKLLGTMTLIGDAIEALSSSVQEMMKSEMPHVKEDMSVIIKSFIGDSNEKNNKLSDNEDK